MASYEVLRLLAVLPFHPDLEWRGNVLTVLHIVWTDLCLSPRYMSSLTSRISDSFISFDQDATQYNFGSRVMFPVWVFPWFVSMAMCLLMRECNYCSGEWTVIHWSHEFWALFIPPLPFKPITQAPKLHYATACMESDLHIVFFHPSS